MTPESGHVFALGLAEVGTVEQDVLLLDNNEPLPENGSTAEEDAAATAGAPVPFYRRLPMVFWFTAGSVALNLLFAVGLYVTARPGSQPLPTVSQARAVDLAAEEMDQTDKLSAVGDGSDAGPRARLVPVPPEKMRPVLEMVATDEAVPDLQRSSVPPMPRQSVPAMPRSSTMELPKSSVPAMPRSSVPAMPQQSTRPAAPRTGSGQDQTFNGVKSQPIATGVPADAPSKYRPIATGVPAPEDDRF